MSADAAGEADPVTFAARSDGAFLVDVLRTHPMVPAGGRLQEDPLLVPPSSSSSSARDERIAERRNRTGMDGPVAGVAESVSTRRWMRDLDALLALPALWVDHEPVEIAGALLSVLFSILGLRGGYARFDDPDGGPPLETWRPTRQEMPAELRRALHIPHPDGSGMRTTDAAAGDAASIRVTSVPLAMPWETGLVVVSAERSDFPTSMEAHLLRVAVGQAAIAVHTARRLAQVDAARSAAEDALRRHTDLLRSLVEAVDPSLTAIARRLRDAARLAAEVDAVVAKRPPSSVGPTPAPRPEGAVDAAPARPLTPREAEVLGLVAQGLSNKEIAGMMRLSHRTVERHLTSLYRKIGVTRRSAATAFALRAGAV